MCVIYPHFERFVFKFLNVKTIFFFHSLAISYCKEGGGGGAGGQGEGLQPPGNHDNMTIKKKKLRGGRQTNNANI